MAELQENMGLNPGDFMDRVIQAKIRASDENAGDSIDIIEKTSAAGKKYQQYTLYVDIAGRNEKLNYLMRNQLNAIVSTYGNKTESWIGNPIEITAEKRGEYTQFVLRPCAEFETESVAG